MTFDPDHLISARHVRAAGGDSSFYRSARAGDFMRLAHGIYLPSAIWRSLSRDERHLARIHAVARRDPDVIVSHWSAARVWGLPSPIEWPTRVDVLRSVTRGSSSPFIRQHHMTLPESLATIDGVIVTSLERTLVDIARSAPMSTAVSMLDFALSERSRRETGRSEFPVTKERLFAELEACSSSRGRAAAARYIDFSDGLAGSVGESVSRSGMFVLGAPAPELQHEFVDAEGSMLTDFWWPKFRAFGEFDGLGKYLKPEFLRPGESTADAVIREKKREDRIRALAPHPTCARWDWPIAWNLPALERHIRAAGVEW